MALVPASASAARDPTVIPSDAMQDELERGCEHVLHAFDLSDAVTGSTDDAPDVVRLTREFSSAITAYHGVPSSEVHRSAILFWWRVRSRLESRFGSIEAFRAHAMQDPAPRSTSQSPSPRSSPTDLGDQRDGSLGARFMPSSRSFLGDSRGSSRRARTATQSSRGRRSDSRTSVSSRRVADRADRISIEPETELVVDRADCGENRRREFSDEERS